MARPEVICEACGSTVEFKDNTVPGRKVRCPDCGRAVAAHPQREPAELAEPELDDDEFRPELQSIRQTGTGRGEQTLPPVPPRVAGHPAEASGPCPVCKYPVALTAPKCKRCGKLFFSESDTPESARRQVAAAPADGLSIAERKAILRGDRAIRRLSIAELRDEQELIVRERRSWKSLALVFLGLALGAPIISLLVFQSMRGNDDVLATAVTLAFVGICIAGFLTGFVAVAKYKGRHPAYGLLVFLGPICLLLLALEDRYRDRLRVIDILLERAEGTRQSTRQGGIPVPE